MASSWRSTGLYSSRDGALFFAWMQLRGTDDPASGDGLSIVECVGLAVMGAALGWLANRAELGFAFSISTIFGAATGLIRGEIGEGGDFAGIPALLVGLLAMILVFVFPMLRRP